MNLKIEICEPSNYQTIADIYNEHIIQHYCTMELNLQTANDIESWVNDFNDRERLYVLKKEEQVIGWGIIKKYSIRLGYYHACEISIYLQKTATGNGYGPMFKKFLIEECKALNYHHIVSKVWANNRASVRYNQKSGFTIVGTQKEIGYIDGKWIDVVIMQYLIK